MMYRSWPAPQTVRRHQAVRGGGNAITGMRLDAPVAVRLDADRLLASVGQELAELGREHLNHGRLHALEAEDGGARAVVADPEAGLVGVWVGVLDGALTGECECAEGTPGDLCGHSVAVTLAALDHGFTFSSIPSRARGVEPEERRFAELAAGLAPRRLIGLVARHAAADPYFAALLQACAGQLPAPGPDEINDARQVIAHAADVPNGSDWDLYHIVKAGREMVAELELLAVRPPTDELLSVVEEAIAVWATLSEHLSEAWRETYETEREEIGSTLAALHLQLCQACPPDPLELAARLAKLIRTSDVDTFLEAPEEYANVLGDEGMAEFEQLTGASGT